jgi:hypothetical protein
MLLEKDRVEIITAIEEAIRQFNLREARVADSKENKQKIYEHLVHGGIPMESQKNPIFCLLAINELDGLKQLDQPPKPMTHTEWAEKKLKEEREARRPEVKTAAQVIAESAAFEEEKRRVRKQEAEDLKNQQERKPTAAQVAAEALRKSKEEACLKTIPSEATMMENLPTPKDKEDAIKSFINIAGKKEGARIYLEVYIPRIRAAEAKKGYIDRQAKVEEKRSEARAKDPHTQAYRQ